MAALPTFDEESLEPREIVRVFSMRIQAQHEEDSEDETEIEKAMIHELQHEKSQQKKRIRQINAYMSSTK